MIFVTIGSCEPFDRLLRAVAALPGDEEIVAQCGPWPTRPERATCVEFLGPDEFAEHLRTARVVIMHAGVGSVLSAAAAGKKPIVVPRLQRPGEAVDDHQLLFARRLHAVGAAVAVEDTEELAAAVAATPAPAHVRPDGGRLASELRDYVDAVLAGASRVPRAALG